MSTTVFSTSQFHVPFFSTSIIFAFDFWCSTYAESYFILFAKFMFPQCYKPTFSAQFIYYFSNLRTTLLSVLISLLIILLIWLLIHFAPTATNVVTGRSLGAKSGTKSPGRTKASPIVQDPDSAPRKKVISCVGHYFPQPCDNICWSQKFEKFDFVTKLPLLQEIHVFNGIKCS